MPTPNPINLSTVAQTTLAAPATGTRVLTLSDLTPPGPDPTRVIASVINTVGLIKVPLDTPLYYTSISIGEYSRTSWDKVGEITKKDDIVFPIPMNLTDTHQISYETEPIGLAGAAALGAGNLALRALNGEVSDLTGALDAAGISAGTGSTVLGAGAAATLRTLGNVGDVGRGIGNGILAAAGLAVNQFLTVMLKGPQYKSRQFSWRFSPRNSLESKRLQEAIMLLNNSMAPGISTTFGSAFFTWPKIFQVQFSYALGRDLGLVTFRMKPSVLKAASFDYTPSGMPAFYAGSSAPEGVNVTLVFDELEFWVNGRNGEPAFK